ncbi:MAG: hypothetical protein JOZ01_02570 [Candidatus Eremiobacteraeota bacterium]|nr:hypothetical protein [Candidatus Eremiobacteraeota bacterium]
MDLQRALSDLAEVRDRLAHVQRFEGYSGPAAAISGLAALVAGFVQFRLAPLPHSPATMHLYVEIWMTCLAVALALNYGTVAVWVVRNRRPGAQSQFRTAARSIAPSVLLGGVLSLALVEHSAYALLPGTWFALYALGLFASRRAIPASTLPITFAFAALALLFLITPLAHVALAWWVMPLGFGAGQIAIGCLIWQGRPT